MSWSAQSCREDVTCIYERVALGEGNEIGCVKDVLSSKFKVFVAKREPRLTWRAEGCGEGTTCIYHYGAPDQVRNISIWRQVRKWKVGFLSMRLSKRGNQVLCAPNGEDLTDSGGGGGEWDA